MALSAPLLAQPRLSIESPNEHNWMRVRAEEAGDNQLLALHASSNLVDWRTIALMHGSSFAFADPATPHLGQRFYRLNAAPLAPTNDWKNQIGFRMNPSICFEAGPTAGSSLLSFWTTRLGSSTRVPADTLFITIL